MPRGFVRIRHYGILSSTWKRARLYQNCSKNLDKKANRSQKGNSKSKTL
ncbi:MAG: hypothetical protein IPO04_19700 [Cytophagaceae bacterium]|nr:hypothetical protein [Cytophagaceae bacterium]